MWPEKETIFKKVCQKCIYDDKLGYVNIDNSTPSCLYFDKEIETFESVQEYCAIRISPYRKGLALYSTLPFPFPLDFVDSFIVNSEKQIIYHFQSCELHEIDHPYIIRAFGGFYVSYVPKHINNRTFPGQDRDTEYDIVPAVKDIITEDGKVLSDTERDIFLLWHIIIHCKENDDGTVVCNNKKYTLEDYMPIIELDW